VRKKEVHSHPERKRGSQFKRGTWHPAEKEFSRKSSGREGDLFVRKNPRHFPGNGWSGRTRMGTSGENRLSVSIREEKNE